ncbi:hypothetical protein ACFV8X_12220 [Streptomyces sp. NPDC059868]|uniref:hypothetical protein n=1 Tax=Streptomyces sp. NPDC059868 TaxID=3346979 RepID=UPI00365958DB
MSRLAPIRRLTSFVNSSRCCTRRQPLLHPPVALLLIRRDDLLRAAVDVRESRAHQPRGRGVRQLPVVVAEPRGLALDQLDQDHVTEAVGTQQPADRHPAPGGLPGELQRLGRRLDLRRVDAPFEHVEEPGDVPGRLLQREPGELLVFLQLGHVHAQPPQQQVGRLLRPGPELLSQTTEERVDIDAHAGNEPKLPNPRRSKLIDRPGSHRATNS